MAHFVNTPSSMVTAALDALVRTSGGALARLDGYPEIKVVLRAAPARPDRVAVISGGGAGHEPAHAGFVGEGMLTAAVSGEIFASPGVAAVLAAIMAVTGEAGCLLVVKNYTGDRLNFGLAAERARAAGKHVEMVIVADDVALPGAAQPRGISGTLIVHKVAGAAAESGASLADVTAQARSAATAVRTIGVSLSGADIPFRAPARAFPPSGGELGLGIHGEPGAEMITVENSQAVVGRMSGLLEEALPASGPLAILLNNLGGVSGLELGVVTDDVLATPLGQRAELVLGPASLMTSLSMRGFSISAIPLDDPLRAALRAPVGATVAWPGVRAVSPLAVRELPPALVPARAAPSAEPLVRRRLEAACAAVLADRARLDALDAQVGDGDTGSTFAAAARRISDDLDALPLAEPAALCHELASLASLSMGGSSGVLISIMLTAAGAAMQDGRTLAASLTQGLDAMTNYGGARPGGRTMLDALAPAVEVLRDGGSLAAAAAAARRGADATAEVGVTASGRSAYVPAVHLLGVPDPGAEAVAVILGAMAAA
jgi:dihydroxyacetone kinase